MKIKLTVIAFVLWAAFCANAQQIDREKISEDIEKNGCVVTDDDKVKICKFDYRYKNKLVEALTFQPNTGGKFPSILLIPGYQGTAKIYLGLGIIFAKAGFASMSIGTPGFGKTELKPDFLGKNTINAYIKGYKKFEQAAFVDKKNLGIFGYSRGAIAASLMITKLKNVEAAVVGGGMYDLKKAYAELTMEGIKENIKLETGLSEKSFKARSAALQAKKITSPVLIIHGENDLNAPTTQAYLFNDELKKQQKDVELQILANHKHGWLGGDFLKIVIDFFSRKLKRI